MICVLSRGSIVTRPMPEIEPTQECFIYLITGCTTWLYLLCMVSATVNLGVSAVIKVDEVHQQFVAFRAREARRVPADSWADAAGQDHHLTQVDPNLAVLTFLR